jgi:hypothetical protein
MRLNLLDRTTAAVAAFMDTDPLYQQWPDLRLYLGLTLQILDDFVGSDCDKINSKETTSGRM